MRTVLIVLYCSMVLSPVLRYELHFYVFEAGVMLLNSAIWNVFCPGRFSPQSHRVYLARDGVTEFVDDQKDDRTVIAKIFSILPFGCLNRKHENRHFEELDDYEMSNRGS